MTIKTNRGGSIAAGGFVAGVIVMGIISGATFRLVSDQSSSAILAAAEDAADRVEAAASAINYVTGYGAVDLTGAVSAQTVIEAAVAWSYANNTPLFWPDGTYLSTATIPNFHDVRHEGPGVVKRGTDLFAVNPAEGQTNTLYVSTGGSSTADGLSSSQPISSLQGAFDALKHYWPLDGKWVVKLAAGTYSAPSQRTARLGPANSDMTAAGTDMKNAITIQGPDVGYDPATNPEPIPAAIFDAGGAAAVGIQLERGVKALVKDIKFQNYSGSSSSIGLSIDGAGWLRTENVHASGSVYGISATNHALLDVKGGAITACTNGIRSLFNTKHEIGNQLAGVVGQGPFIRGCTSNGFMAQEGATGHSDFVTYEDNAVGVLATVNARVNLNGSTFKRNSVAVRAQAGNVFPSGVNWNMGTADANTEVIRVQDAGSIASENSTAWREIAANLAPTASSGTTETTVASFTLDTYKLSSVPTSIYAGKAIRIRAAGTITGVAGTKSVRARLGGSLLAGATIEADANGGFVFEAEIRLLTSATQATALKLETGVGTNRVKVGTGTSSVNTIAAGTLPLTFTVQCANVGDGVTTSWVSAEIKG
ncbi:hypothetical protein [Sinorhizobium fredii]|uniref:hypothetical protein n=1 Tax=Rhizobium fredii TaxID=380 RepID=UPI003396E8DF